MPTNYEWGLFLHIIGVFGIAGAAASFWVAMSVMRRLALGESGRCRSCGRGRRRRCGPTADVSS